MTSFSRKHALLTGISLLIMAIAAGFGYGYVISSLVVPDNAELTLTNLNRDPGLFGNGVIAWVLILLTDLIVAWSMYQFFRHVDHKISLLTGIIRAIYSLILAIAIYQLISVWQLLPTTEPIAAQIMGLIRGFEEYWSWGLVLFGFHLLGLGYLSIKSKAVPKWIGWLLYVAGISYTLIHGAKGILSHDEALITTAEMVLGFPMAIAELALAVWLLVRGGK